MKSRAAIFIVGIAMLFSLAQRSGAQWTKVGSPGDGWITALAISGTSFFAGTFEGVFLSTDNGTSWTAINSGLPKKLDVSCFAVMGTNVFAGTDYGVFLTANNGSSWKPVNSGLPKDPYVECLEVMGTNLFAGTWDGVFLSTDKGKSWIAVNSGLPETGGLICDLAVMGTNLFAGMAGGATTFGFIKGGVFRSTNNGKSWKKVNSGLPDALSIWRLEVMGTNLFASNANDGIFRSTNNGKSWEAINSGLPEKWDYSGKKIFMPKSLYAGPCLAVSGSNLFAGTINGVFLSTNQGESWKAISSGLPKDPDADVWCFAVSGPNLFAAICGHGVWRLSLSDLSSEKR